MVSIVHPTVTVVSYAKRNSLITKVNNNITGLLVQY